MRRITESMSQVRKYGSEPFKVAVLHGGPGAPGYMAPVARELSRDGGVLEPIQARDTLDGQIAELEEQLAAHADPPVILIGSSWGAVLALFMAARHGRLIGELILVGSPVFDSASSSRIESRRLGRMDPDSQKRLNYLQKEMKHASSEKLKGLSEEWGSIFFKTDVYDPITTDLEVIEVQYELHKKVWSDFTNLRDTPGYLKSEFEKIDKPVTVIHGDYDPHPIEGVRPFLEDCIADIEFHILAGCGHYPWIERNARFRFYEILRREIGWSG